MFDNMDTGWMIMTITEVINNLRHFS